MNIHEFYSMIFRIWRPRRMLAFEKIIKPKQGEILLDVGGTPETWISRPRVLARIDCLNVHSFNRDNSKSERPDIQTVLGNGCQLTYANFSYDILFSNSVIEHVGNWERQQEFAREARRVGIRLWIQTPAYECPIEPHYLALCIHWFPIRIRRRMMRWWTIWGWVTKPCQADVDKELASTQLLRKRQMLELFPDCQILTERLFWIIPKSYVAYRLNI